MWNYGGSVAINALVVALRYQPELADEIARRRSDGQTVDEIRDWLKDETGVAIGRESVRAYCARLPKAAT